MCAAVLQRALVDPMPSLKPEGRFGVLLTQFGTRNNRNMFVHVFFPFQCVESVPSAGCGLFCSYPLRVVCDLSRRVNETQVVLLTPNVFRGVVQLGDNKIR